jgi:hypothetical protein
LEIEPMSEQIASTPQCDAVLLPYLQASDETAASAALEQLICESAQPIAREIIHSKLRVGQSANRDISDDEAADLAGDVTLRLVARLRELKSDPIAKAVNSFRGYVAVTTYHACDEYLRKKYPRRHSLKNQLRYVITHSVGFAVWEGDKGEFLCGLTVWKEQGRRAANRSRIRESLDQFPRSNKTKSSPPDLLAAIFDRAGGPLPLDDLVSLVADLWQIRDVAPAASIEGDPAGVRPDKTESRAGPDARMDERSHLERLWAEICELPLRQRVALLLSLRDSSGRGVLTLLPLIHIASLRQIAESLGMPGEKLASLWNQLPLDDATIAEYLAITRQQVINLRKCARERLWRRTREFVG